MNLRNGKINSFKRVENRDRSMGIAGGVDDDRVVPASRRVYKLDQDAFMIRLMNINFNAQPRSALTAELD